jgi:hypothetical protein
VETQREEVDIDTLEFSKRLLTHCKIGGSSQRVLVKLTHSAFLCLHAGSDALHL